MFVPKKIFIHCTASPNGKKLDPVDDLFQWHVVERGWKKVGYHFVINPDGSKIDLSNFEWMRSISEMGAHAKGHNKDSIAIALAGTDKFTRQQFYKLHEIVHWFKGHFGVTVPADIMCHYEVNPNKTCPGILRDPLVAFLLTQDLNVVTEYVYSEPRDPIPTGVKKKCKNRF